MMIHNSSAIMTQLAASDEITVAVLTFNSLRTIHATLASLKTQSVKMKLLLIDHGSTDGTLPVLREFARKNPWARVVVRAENNIARSRQFAVEECDSEWLAFVDSDVMLPPAWLETAWRWADARNDVAGVGGVLHLFPHDKWMRVLPLMQKGFLGHIGSEQMMQVKQMKLATHLPTAACLFRRAHVIGAGGFDSQMGNCGEDLELGTRMVGQGRSLWIIPELNAHHLLSTKTLREWWIRVFRFGAARARVVRRHPRLLLKMRSWMVIGFLVAHLGLIGAQMWTVLAVLEFSYFCLIVLSFWRYCRGAERLNVAWTAWLTHHAYAWGMLRGLWPS